ncbi:host specificity protein [Enterobacterales bacterium CwR94]|nr:host specificity protein [Enterobacterales bacterium CwR94]
MRLIDGGGIGGSKGGGGSAYTPVEQPDDLLSDGVTKMLLAIAEGEIQGELTAQQIYLDDTPLANDDGSFNFKDVKWEYRTGQQDQTYIKGMPEVANELGVGLVIRQNQPWTRQFTNLTLDAVRIKLSLPVQYLYKNNGDQVGTVTQYAVELSTDGGAYQTIVNGKFDGKTTSTYQRDHRIDLPRATTGWSLRVRRITPDSNDSKLINAFSLFSYAEVIDSKLRYPNTALLYVEFGSAQFNGRAPKVTCKPKGKRIRVPSNYDPVTRTYTGAWAGDFKMAYSNNPAWVFYDLVLDKIYGMGNRVDASMIDRWELYAISQYCDQMVPNGADGTEPRFTCNVYIQSQQDAYNVLKDIAAIFRGITFWGNNQIYVSADVPVDDVAFSYHASNVIDGFFNYGGGSYKNRYSSCLVSYSDPANHYSDTIEAVYDSELVSRYDVNQTQLTAIGCTSQSEAHRRGRWVLLSNANDGTISFSVGLDGQIPMPADVIAVADPLLAGKANGGRIRSVAGLSVTLDRAADYAAGDRLIVNLEDGTAQTRTIASISADKHTVTVNTAFRIQPVAGAVWAIDSDNLAVQYYRVTSITEGESGTFTIAGVVHDPNKYRFIDDGVRITPPPITVTPIKTVPAPKNIVITEVDHVSQGVTVATMEVSWDRVDGAIKYVAQWRKDNGDWVNVGQTGTQGFSVAGIYAGSYDVRVRAVNAAEVSSPWGSASTTTLPGKIGKPGTPVSLLASTDVVWNINLTWAFPAGSGDTAYTELQVATTADGQNPQLLTLVPYPGVDYQHGPMPAGAVRWYRARLVDKIGNTGDWSSFVRGASNSEASDLIGDAVEDFLNSPDGKELLTPVETSPEAIIQNALANNYAVESEWARYGQNSAAIIEARKVASDAQSSVASLETSVTAKFDDTEAALQEKLTAYADANGGSAIYTMKTGLKYNGVNYDAGLSIAAVVNGTQVDTRVAINANKFVIMSGSGDNFYSPFVVQNGQVFISQGFIGDGWIQNAMIGNFIQSNNYVVNTTGWRLDKTGTFENNGAVPGEGKMKQTNTTISIADGSNRLRVQIGRLTGVF